MTTTFWFHKTANGVHRLGDMRFKTGMLHQRKEQSRPSHKPSGKIFCLLSYPNKMVLITELPAEILHHILVAFCEGGGTFWGPKGEVKRALRLKLVCSECMSHGLLVCTTSRVFPGRFRQALQQAVFESRILGNWGQCYRRLYPWPLERHRYGADEFWHA